MKTVNTDLLHFIGAVLLFALWAYIVEYGRATPTEALLVNAIQLALVGLGVFKAAMAVPGGSTNAPSSSQQPGAPQ
jgi:hypothetical protein